MPKVVKFGGSSLASAAQFQKQEKSSGVKIKEICCTVSTWKARLKDIKLQICCICVMKKHRVGGLFEEWTFITSRYEEIISGLSLTLSLAKNLRSSEHNLKQRSESSTQPPEENT